MIKDWFEKYRSAIARRDMEAYAALFSEKVEYYSEPFEGDEGSPFGSHMQSVMEMDPDLSFGESEIVMLDEIANKAVFKYTLYFKWEKDTRPTFTEYVIITKFKNNPKTNQLECSYYSAIWWTKAW